MTDRPHESDPLHGAHTAHNADDDDARAIGGVPREGLHPMYPPDRMREEAVRQGLDGLDDRAPADDAGGPYRSRPEHESETKPERRPRSDR